jgi:Carboxypeptidase regulatory-like domain/TonB-dependent Receptor Plug Domain
MSNQFKSLRCILTLLACLVALCICASPAIGQISGTGGLTGTVTDPSGAVISGATVTAINIDTGETRTTATDARGSYKFSLLPPGNYRVTFSARGFKTLEVPSVAVSVTENATLNRTLEVGAQSEQVTVEGTAQGIQTENATVGTLVGSDEVNSLPLSSRNYTEILDISPGVVANVASATAWGNGTQDVNVNGTNADQNNYQMDGASITNYGSGAASQSGNYAPVGIPNPDSIQEFKIQTSQYDASYGRNPGASVNVVTKGGTNSYHGDAWEFVRNNFFNANDFFLKNQELSPGGSGVNTPPEFKENQFGFTFGGPVKKNKVFFFGSYQGTRQLNGVVVQGYSAGVNLPAINDYADVASGLCANVRCTNNTAAYQAYLGREFGAGGPQAQAAVSGSIPIAANGSNISPVAIAILQAAGPSTGYNKGFFVPGAPAGCAGNCLSNITDPAYANENQFLVNTDYDLNSKQTLSERYFHSSDPWENNFDCFGTCMPGQPELENYTSDEGVVKLTSVITSNMVNQVRFALNRLVTQNTDDFSLTACDVGMIPGVANGEPCGTFSTAGDNPDVLKLPSFGIAGITPAGIFNAGAFDFGGNPYSDNVNAITTFQGGDDLSWAFGKQTIRVGMEVDRTQWNFDQPAGSRGFLDFDTLGDFLYGGPGSIAAGIFADREPPNGDYHLLRLNDFSSYVQDDVKVSKRLTVNLGVRWEYDGLPTDNTGLFTNVWQGLLSQVNTGSFFNANPQGTLAGFVVQNNYAANSTVCGGIACGYQSPTGATGIFVNNNKTLFPHGAPWDVFSPRFGLAWQPIGSKLVIRAGYGWFHDQVYGNLLGDQLMGNTPYNYPYPASQFVLQSLADPYPASFLGQTCVRVTSTGQCPALGWLPRTMAAPTSFAADSQYFQVPLTQQYNLDLQYQFASNWTLDIGYVGTHSTQQYDWNQDLNPDYVIAGAPNTPAGLFGEVAESSLPYNDPLNPKSDWVTTNQGPTFFGFVQSTNQNQRAAYLGVAPGGYVSTGTNGAGIYNSLQAQLTHHFSHGLLIQAAYTWSKLITDVNAPEATTSAEVGQVGNVTSGGLTSGYPLNAAQQYGLAAFNRPQRFVISYSYALPWKSQGWSEKVLGGWTISGVTTVQDGEPFTVTDSSLGSIYGFTDFSGPGRAELASPTKCNSLGNCQSAIPFSTSGGIESRLGGSVSANGYINAAAFQPYDSTLASSPLCVGGTPNPGGSPSAPCGSAGAPFVNAGTAFGDSGVGIMFGPGQFNFDMALAKLTPITEGTHIEFRLEAYNLFNHPQFNNPESTALSAVGTTFGVINSTSVPPRVLQLGLKFVF